jgi:hypothetical protein
MMAMTAAGGDLGEVKGMHSWNYLEPVNENIAPKPCLMESCYLGEALFSN